MNENSSRSHTVFQLHVQNIDADATDGDNAESEAPAFVSTLNLVDLAGRCTMKVSAGKASRMKENQYQSKPADVGESHQKLVNEPKGHIPYRDSQLTHPRKVARWKCTSLSFARQHLPMRTCTTQGTLYFASNACRVKTHARVNKVAASKTMIGRHADEVKKLKSQLRFEIPRDDERKSKMRKAVSAAMNDMVTADAKKAIARRPRRAALRRR